MNTPFFPGTETLVEPFKFPASPYEYKVTPLRECPTPADMQESFGSFVAMDSSSATFAFNASVSDTPDLNRR
ncbi:MAG: hypothetical protein WBS33_10595 [Verrucomicrobiia bacterium]